MSDTTTVKFASPILANVFAQWMEENGLRAFMESDEYQAAMQLDCPSIGWAEVILGEYMDRATNVVEIG